jgi:outer membrane autotransporter protein
VRLCQARVCGLRRYQHRLSLKRPPRLQSPQPRFQHIRTERFPAAGARSSTEIRTCDNFSNFYKSANPLTAIENFTERHTDSQRPIGRKLRIRRHRKARVVVPLLFALYLGALVTPARGATWVGVGGTFSGLWNAQQNWAKPGGAIPTDTAIFIDHPPTTITISQTSQHPEPVTEIGTILFESGAVSYSFINQTTFNINGTGIENLSTSEQHFTNNFELNFLNSSTAGNALTIITTNSGGRTSFFDHSTGGLARFISNSGGVVDISTLTSGGMTAGSIEGAGTYNLGSKKFTVGLNNLTTTVSGVITDGGAAGGTGGSLTKDGTGRLTLTGENTYSGGTTINGGTLQLGNGGTTPNIIGNVEDNGTLVFKRSGAKKTFDGVISGSGSVVKIGSDILELTADNIYSGGTTIRDGVLVAGVPIAGQGTSFALGTGNVFLQGGTLRAPSLDPVVINVAGNYKQGTNGTLQLGVAGINGSKYDHVQVAGSASLHGRLLVNSLGGFHPANGNAFGVLETTNGTRSGTFAHINDQLNFNPNLQRIDIYAPNGVALLYVTTGPGPTPTPTPAPSSTPGPSPTPTPPRPGPTPPPIIDLIPEPLPPVNPKEPLLLSFLLKVLNPTAEQLTSMFEIPFSAADTQRFNLNDRMAQIQSGSTGFVSPFSPAPLPSPTGKEIGKEEIAPAVFTPNPTNRWGVWLNGWGDWVSIDNDNSIKGYDFTIGGISLGIDYRITDYLAVGLFGSYAHTWTSLSPGDVGVNTGRGGLYATYWNQGFYVNGGVFGGHNSYDTSRQTLLQGRFANGSTSGYEFSTFVDTGYDFHLGNLSFGPVFAAQYTNVHIDSYTEQASLLALDVHSDSEESWRTDLGFQAFYTWRVGQITVIPSLRAAWEHEYKYTALPITFSAANFPGVTVTAFGANEGHDSFVINAGAGIQWTPGISTYVGYQGQLGRRNYSANGVTGTISFSF